MRDIEFRGKSVNTGEWLYGDLLRYAGWAQIWCLNENGGRNNYIVDPATVGQYTGLTGKCGQKIFEGDVVQTSQYGVDDGKGRNHAGNDKFEVIFADGAFRLEQQWRRFNLVNGEHCEVIGNIHEQEEHR